MTDVVKTYPNGGVIEVYRQVDRAASDYQKVFACCDFFAMQGKRVVITPRFGETVGNPLYHSIYASLYGTKFWGKCPDFCVDGVWYEHEGYDETKDLTDPRKRANTFFKMVTRGIKQSERIIIEDCQAGRRWARKNIFNRVHYEKQDIKEVFIRTHAGLERLY